MRPCRHCGGDTLKVIFIGLPGRFCERCSTLDGLAAYAPPVASNTYDGPMFAFFVYEGSYWRGLWHWIKGDAQ